MAVFITGGHGHIGSWAAYFLAQQGHHCLLFDAHPVALDYLKPVSHNIEFIKGDVLNFAGLTEIFHQRQGEIDGILHTVGIMGEIVQSNPYGNVGLNIGGTHNMLEIARIFEIPKVVYTSTGAVYGAISGIASEEKHRADPPDLYSSTKVASEYLGQNYAKTFGFDFRIARLYFCYGPGKYPANFIRLYQMAFGALEGLEGLEMDRGADQRLDFTYIEDAGRGTALLYQADDLQYDTFNIATGTPNRVGKVAELAQKYSPYSVKVTLGPGELMQRCEALDIGRARDALGFEPQYGLEEGIQRYAEWLEKNPRNVRE